MSDLDLDGLSLGGIIRTLRVRSLDISQQTLSDLTGGQISRNSIAQIETGNTKKPQRDNLRVLASCLNIDVNILFKAAGYKPDPPKGEEGLVKPEGVVVTQRYLLIPEEFSNTEVKLIEMYIETLRLQKSLQSPTNRGAVQRALLKQTEEGEEPPPVSGSRK